MLIISSRISLFVLVVLFAFPFVTSWRNRNLKVYQTHTFEVNRRNRKRIQAIIAFEQTRCTIGQLLVLTARDLVPAADSSIGTGIYRAYTVRSRGLITHRHLEQFQPATTFVAS
jgi:cytochrome c-type biogenesis protein CcmH/NrfG